MAKMVCRKCGAKVRVAEGQKFDEKRRTYSVMYQVACYHCGETGPLSRTATGAIDAWEKEAQEGPQLLDGYGG